jgi:hypothetical protein
VTDLGSQIDTSVDIAAPAETVWGVLTDLERYPLWNPFITRIAGDLRVGQRLTVTLQPPNGKGMTFRPKLQVVEPNRRLVWLGHLFVAGIFDGCHEFTLSPTNTGGTILSQSETFRGLLVPFLGRTLDQTRSGFTALNQALKRRAESVCHS